MIFRCCLPKDFFIHAVECPIIVDCYAVVAGGWRELYLGKHSLLDVSIGQEEVGCVGFQCACYFVCSGFPIVSVDARELVEYAGHTACIEGKGQDDGGGNASLQFAEIQYIRSCLGFGDGNWGFAVAVDDEVGGYRAVLVFDVCAVAAYTGCIIHAIDCGVVVEVVLEGGAVALFYSCYCAISSVTRYFGVDYEVVFKCSGV